MNMHILEAEMAVLAGLIYDNSTYEHLADVLKEEHFFDPVHREMFKTVVSLIERGHLANQVTVTPYFINTDAVKTRGGEVYLKSIYSSILSISYIREYAKQIREMYIRRELFKVGSELQVKANEMNTESNAENIIDNAENKLFSLCQAGEGSKKARDFGFVAGEVLRQAKEILASDYKTAGIPTGFTDLDRHMGGLYPSDLIILAGRPSMGKTALATNIAFFVARSVNKGVLFFSLEMSDEQLALRILGQEAGIPSDRIRRGMISQGDINTINNVAKSLAGLPLYIDDTPALTIAGIRTRARRVVSQQQKKGEPIGLIVIDYLQLLSTGSYSENRVQELSFITRSLKAMAKELNLPVISLSQLSRAVEQREDRRPQLSDLRESGSIEQDADAVWFIYREEYYEARKKPPDDSPKVGQWQKRMEQIHDMAELIIAKQRHGPIATVPLAYKAEYTKFSNYIRKEFRM